MLMAKERELKEAVREGRDRVSEQTLVFFLAYSTLYFGGWLHCLVQLFDCQEYRR